MEKLLIFFSSREEMLLACVWVDYWIKVFLRNVFLREGPPQALNIYILNKNYLFNSSTEQRSYNTHIVINMYILLPDTVYVGVVLSLYSAIGILELWLGHRYRQNGTAQWVFYALALIQECSFAFYVARKWVGWLHNQHQRRFQRIKWTFRCLSGDVTLPRLRPASRDRK